MMLSMSERFTIKSGLSFLVPSLCLSLCLLLSQAAGQWHGLSHLTGHAESQQSFDHEPASADCEVLDSLLLCVALVGQTQAAHTLHPHQAHASQYATSDDTGRRYTNLARGPPLSFSS